MTSHLSLTLASAANEDRIFLGFARIKDLVARGRADLDKGLWTQEEINQHDECGDFNWVLRECALVDLVL